VWLHSISEPARAGQLSARCGRDVIQEKGSILAGQAQRIAFQRLAQRRTGELLELTLMQDAGFLVGLLGFLHKV